MLQVIPALEAGGAERGCVDVAAALVAAGGRALVAAAGGRLAAELERAGAVFLPMPLDSKNPLVVAANARRLAAAIAAHGVDLVHARSRAPAWSALWAARARGVPLVTTFHGIYGAGSGPKRAYNRVMLRGARSIAVSAYVAGHIRAVYGVGPERVRVIPRGIDLAAFDPAVLDPRRVAALRREWEIPPSRRVVLLPGRLARWKGHRVLIAALAGLDPARRRGLVAVLAGEARGHEGHRRALAEEARRLGLAERVRFVGHVADMPAAYAVSDVVVAPSIAPEAFGRVPVEAQAMGRPVIAADHGGARETILPGVTGWLVPPNDAPALARTLAAVLDLDAEACAGLAARARAHVAARFAVARMCADTLALYRAVLAEQKA